MLALTNHKSMKEKLTRSQERVLHLLQHHDRAVSAQDIHSELRNSENSVGLATVYRSLDTLKLQGLIKALLGNQLAKKHTFQIYYHTLEFFGLCTECQQQPQ